jgi:hypothetical protein
MNLSDFKYIFYTSCIVIAISGWLLFFFYPKQIDYTNSSKKEKYELLVESYNSFMVLSPEEIVHLWISEFFDTNYVLKNGNILDDQFNCSTSAVYFLRKFGALVPMENSTHLGDILDKLCKIGLAEQRKSLKEVQSKDIIIRKTRSSGVGHIMLVVDVHKGVIRYLDINNEDKGVGLNTLKWGEWKIRGIYSLSFAFWCGDFLKELRGL